MKLKSLENILKVQEQIQGLANRMSTSDDITYSYSRKKMNKKSLQNPKKIAPSKTKAAVPARRSSSINNLSKNSEVGGPSGLEPTRYGDWERKGRCIDF